MRKVIPFLMFFCLLIPLAGCAPQLSLFPLFTGSDREFDESLLGDWNFQVAAEFKPEGETRRMTFRKGVDASYEVTAFDLDEKKVRFAMTARLVRLGRTLFIDFGAPDSDERTFADIPFPTIPAHVFGVISVRGQSARIDFLNDDWVTRQAKAGSLPLAITRSPGEPLLAASTEELRKFALEHAEDKEAFSESYSLRRIK